MARGFKIMLKVTFLGLLITSFLGCATFRRKDLDLQALKNQIRVLEVQLEQKDEEIASLRETLNKEMQERQELIERLEKVKSIKVTKSEPSTRQIQTALKNAGYNPGPIDGKMGEKTRAAIRAFQRANDLKVDGRVGKRTWRILKRYLYRKVK